MFIPLYSVHLFRNQQKCGRLPSGITGRNAPESVVDLLRNDWSTWAGICTKTILGINCVVVHDYETVNGVLSEDTLDWYAQDDAGNIWYFGEATKKCLCVDDCESEECIDRTGSWEAGVDGALPGYLILDPEPKPGVCYQQESAQGAQDMAKVLRLNAKVILGNGESYTDCLETKEWSALEPGVIEHKYYAPGVGLVLIEELKGKTGRVELIDKYFEEN